MTKTINLNGATYHVAFDAAGAISKIQVVRFSGNGPKLDTVARRTSRWLAVAAASSEGETK